MRQGKGKEKSAQGRAGDIGKLPDGTAPGDRVDKMPFRDQVGDQRRTGGPGECASCSDKKENSVDGIHALQPGSGEHEQTGGANNLQRVANEDDLPAVKAVSHVAGRKDEQQARKKQGQSGIAQVQRPVGNGVNLPRHRDRLRLGAEDGHQPRQLVSLEVAERKGFHAANGRFGGDGIHRLPLA